jgi:hypothetical protein
MKGEQGAGEDRVPGRADDRTCSRRQRGTGIVLVDARETGPFGGSVLLFGYCRATFQVPDVI